MSGVFSVTEDGDVVPANRVLLTLPLIEEQRPTPRFRQKKMPDGHLLLQQAFVTINHTTGGNVISTRWVAVEEVDWRTPDLE